MRRSSVHSLVAGAAVVGVVLAVVTLAGPASAAGTARATRTALASARPTAGKAVTLTATVTPKPSRGTVRFTASGTTLASCGARPVAHSTGKATCRTTFRTAGRRTVVARYSGASKRYRASSAKRVITTATAVTPTKPVATKPAAVGTVVGSVGSCTTSKGALVAVDYKTWSGPIVRGCDPAPTTGIKLLTTAKFTTTGTQHDGPQFICRIGNPLFASGTQYPTSATEKCVSTPPATAYWSFWLAKKGSNTWTYSTLGAYSDKPVAGEVEAWTYGGTDIAGTTGQPSFTPNQVRAGLPTPSASVRRAAVSRAAAAAPKADLGKAVSYLTTTTTANGVASDGSSLAKNGYYDSFVVEKGNDYADFGLTLDGAFALAATGTDDAALAKIVKFFNTNTKDGAGRDALGWTGIGTEYASGGSIGKEALLAEVTGYDPRDFGGKDLIAELDKAVCTEASDACAGKGNYLYAQSTFSQALGVIAQLRAGDTTGAASPIAFLESTQDDKTGAFPSIIPSTGDSEVDSTAMAAMALDLVHSDAADAAVRKAVAWLATQQKADGGFPGASGDSTNSAALAIQGLSLGGSAYRDEIAKASAFLARLQNKDGGFAVTADGGDSDVRASTQVVGGLVGTSFATLSDNIRTATPKLDAGAAAAWLVTKLTGGTHLEFDGGYGPDYGGTADVAIALAATGTQDKTLIKLVRYLAAHVADYADPTGTAGGPYAGSFGKLAVLAEITGQDPHHFGGYDLLKQLSDNVCTAVDADHGCQAAGDLVGGFSTTSSAFGVLAFERAGETPPAALLTRLLSLQCKADGGFPSALPTDTDAGTCPTGTDAPVGAASEVDTTGFVLQSLVNEPTAGDAVARALAYLRATQNDDGSWTGAAGHNSNSTALGVQGVLAAPAFAEHRSPAVAGVRSFAAVSDPAVKRAYAFLATLQNGNGGFGINTDASTSDVRATDQTVPAIVGATLTTLTHPISLDSGSSGGSGGGSGGSGGGSGGTTGGSGSGSGSAGDGSGGSQAAGATANTGVPSEQLLIWAALLLLVGAGVTVAGRRPRVARAAGGRHRGEAA
ncbi:prenyltransferase/squalene oxidase repeat-containing protein [uncultured Jatrophihabitans sp.]|uniref:Ig-like domain repeat protein n=1 Tax=uncultured Jatrophihabitans sp. TaxID=1610747 RepID=UPI0035CA293C